MVIETVKNTIQQNNLLQNDEHIVIGLSGGPDSVCLFHVLYQLRQDYSLTLHAVHINHKIRPGAAEEDQAYAEEFCRQLGVTCKTFTFDVERIAKETGTSSEDAGRKLRYQSFYQVADSIAAETGKTVRIAIAQNRNDQAETVLMRIMRGTGTDGLSGIEYARKGENGMQIIRPLLDVSRTEILQYCKENHLEPRIDLTNLEPIYTRNKIRLELLPYMEKNFNENIVSALNKLSKIAKEDKDYFSARVDELIAEYVEIKRGISASVWGDTNVGFAEMPVRILSELHPAIRHRLIVRIFSMLGLIKDIGAIHLDNADRLLLEGKTSVSTDFPSGYSLAISYEKAVFYKKDAKNNLQVEYKINKEGITNVVELNGQLKVKFLTRDEWLEKKMLMKSKGLPLNACFLDYNKIQKSSCSLILRLRKPGDYIVPLGMKGSKKIQDLFVDLKIGKEKRDCIPLVCLGTEVLWVIGHRMSENFKVGDETEVIISLEYDTKL